MSDESSPYILQEPLLLEFAKGWSPRQVQRKSSPLPFRLESSFQNTPASRDIWVESTN